MAEFERIEKVSYLRIFTHNINKRKFMISCCGSQREDNGVPAKETKWSDFEQEPPLQYFRF